LRSNDEKFMKREQLDMTYYGNDCATRYWVYNEELGCIAGGHITTPNEELAEELKTRSKQKAV
jgi:hypothetical protein